MSWRKKALSQVRWELEPLYLPATQNFSGTPDGGLWRKMQDMIDTARSLGITREELNAMMEILYEEE